jgi:hypothetical protein
MLPFASMRVWKPSKRAGKPSTGIARRKREPNITGARKKIEENGFEVAGLRRRRICVRPQRKPEKNAADITRMKPRAEKSTSPATIITTPPVMVAIMATSRHDGDSRRKRKANNNTNASEDDLHIADRNVSLRTPSLVTELTVKCKTNIS